MSCCGVCISAGDLGVGGADQIAYVNPICEVHNENWQEDYDEWQRSLQKKNE